MVGAADGQFQDLGDGQSRQPDGARGRAVDMGKILLMTVLEHFQQGGIEDLLLRVLGQLIGPDWLEVHHAELMAVMMLFVAGNHGIAHVVLHCQFDVLLKRQGYAVDFIKCIGEMGYREIIIG